MMLHVLLLLDASSDEVLAVCRSALGVLTAASRTRDATALDADGAVMDIEALDALLGAGDEARLAFPDGAAMVVRRVRLEQ